jgi:Uncharacterized conserved protein (COG2071)
MHFPQIHGVIDRRILVNYRVDPEVLARLVPSPFRLHLVNGFGMAGICLIRLKGIRLRGLPAFFGIGSENAAHRIAIEWDENGEIRHGVYVPRRDSSSLWNALVGGRIFPGVHHHSHFSVAESSDEYLVKFQNSDGTHVAVEATIAESLPAGSVFESVPEASDFFRQGSVGYSPARTGRCCEGLELCTNHWNLTPLSIRRSESSFYSDPALFPAGSIKFDSAFLMRHIAHEWHWRRPMATRELSTAW